MLSEGFQSSLKPCASREVSEWSGFRGVSEWSETVSFQKGLQECSETVWFQRGFRVV